MSALLLWAALLVPGATEFAGPQDARPFVRCVKCQNEGRRTCPEHDRDDCALEDNVEYCSLVGHCGTCGGTGWVDCPRCENPAVETYLEGKRQRVPAGAEQAATYEREMGRSLSIASSAHFVVICEIGPMKVGKTRLSRHRLLHLYVDRLESLYSDYVGLLGIDDSAFPRRSEVMLWALQEDHQEAGRRFCAFVAINGVYLRGESAIYSVWGARRLFRDDQALYRNVVHHVTHGLASLQSPSRWLGNIGAGWADAGLAHWFEDRVFGICDNYCYQEVNPSRSLRGTGWRVRIRQRVAAGELASLAGVLDVNTADLDAEQHLLAFGVVDYLIGRDARRVNALLTRLRRREPVRSALREEFGLHTIQLEESFRTWVLDSYPTR